MIQKSHTTRLLHYLRRNVHPFNFDIDVRMCHCVSPCPLAQCYSTLPSSSWCQRLFSRLLWKHRAPSLPTVCSKCEEPSVIETGRPRSPFSLGPVELFSGALLLPVWRLGPGSDPRGLLEVASPGPRRWGPSAAGFRGHSLLMGPRALVTPQTFSSGRRSAAGLLQRHLRKQEADLVSVKVWVGINY